MREYEFEATGVTIDALRHLQRPWRGWAEDEDAVTVRCGTGASVRIEVESAVIEPGFQVYRLGASSDEADVEVEIEDPAAPAFAMGLNEVVLFNSEYWIGAPSDGSATVGSGAPGSRPDSATASCIVTDALLLDSGTGERLLVRCAGAPYTLEVVRDPGTIDAFIGPRGYTEG